MSLNLKESDHVYCNKIFDGNAKGSYFAVGEKCNIIFSGCDSSFIQRKRLNKISFSNNVIS